MEKQEGENRQPTVRFKSRGRYRGVKEVVPFTGGNWKRWLEFQREINRLYIFLDLDQTDRSAQGLHEVITQLLQGRDLDVFSDTVARAEDDGADWWRAIVVAMDVLTGRHCPLGTREMLHDEIKSLRKTRSMTVAEYIDKFEDLISLERWILDDDGAAMPESEQCRHFSAGMPRNWQMQVMPQQARWTNRKDLQERYLQCERVEQLTTVNALRSEKGKFVKKPKNKNMKWDKHENKKNLGKRPREQNVGCDYCKTRSKPWKNHNEDECFRNPASPRYKPHMSTDRKNTFKSTKPSMMKNNPSAAAAQVKDSGSTDHDPMQLWHVPSASDEYAAAAEVAVSNNETGKVLRTKVTLKHPLNQQTFTAILDTGTTKSLVATEVVSWYKPQGPPPSYRNVNNELQTARGTITLPFILSEFSDKRECSQQFIIVDQLLHHVILGTDFMQEQGIVIDYKNGTISWDGVELSMETRSEPQRRVVVAIQGAEDRTMRILDVTGKEIDLSKLIPKENLTSDQKARLWDVLQTFRVVFLGGPGKMKLKPYELPIKPGSTPKAQRPYPVPLIYREATLREVERLAKLGVLEADKDSPWAAPAFVIQKKMDRSDFSQIFVVSISVYNDTIIRCPEFRI